MQKSKQAETVKATWIHLLIHQYKNSLSKEVKHDELYQSKICTRVRSFWVVDALLTASCTMSFCHIMKRQKSTMCYQQLDRLNTALQDKRPALMKLRCVRLHHNNVNLTCRFKSNIKYIRWVGNFVVIQQTLEISLHWNIMFPWV